VAPALEGRHALVTGGGRGIGEAIAVRLALEGARVTLLGRDRARLEAVAATLARPGRVVVADVADSAAMDDAFVAAVTHSGPVDILVNNAGAARSAPLERAPPDLWHEMLAVNLTGTYHGIRAVLPGMIERRHGRIINIASTAGIRGYAYVTAYTAAKHGVVGLTRALALEVAKQGITVNAVCPGYTETDLVREAVGRIEATTGRSNAEARASLVRSNPQGRFVQPVEVAHAVAWLCLPGTESVTGQSIAVAGGETQ
jgi:NAD(P)-dependent dehydrogenase (short-subunit alcohol dehydrogenase family)